MVGAACCCSPQQYSQTSADPAAAVQQLVRPLFSNILLLPIEKNGRNRRTFLPRFIVENSSRVGREFISTEGECTEETYTTLGFSSSFPLNSLFAHVRSWRKAKGLPHFTDGHIPRLHIQYFVAEWIWPKAHWLWHSLTFMLHPDQCRAVRELNRYVFSAIPNGPT